jgi:hypothetical protein
VEDLLLQSFVNLVGDGIGGLQETDIPSLVSEDGFSVHEEFPLRNLRRKEFLEKEPGNNHLTTWLPEMESMYPCIHEYIYKNGMGLSSLKLAFKLALN